MLSLEKYLAICNNLIDMCSKVHNNALQKKETSVYVQEEIRLLRSTCRAQGSTMLVNTSIEALSKTSDLIQSKILSGDTVNLDADYALMRTQLAALRQLIYNYVSN